MWININTGGTFVLHADIRYELWKEGQEAPGVLTDEYLATVGYMPVKKIPVSYDPITQGVSAQPPISNEGVWEQHFVTYDLDPATIANNQNIIEAQSRAQWQSVSPAQFREAMIDTPHGEGVLFDAVEAIVATLERKKQLKWEFATTVLRSNPDVIAINAALGRTETQLDELFQLAASL